MAQHDHHGQKPSSGEPVQPAAWPFETAETASLRVRTDLLLALQNYLREEGWSIQQAAQRLSANPVQIQHLVNGEISRFTSEQLIVLLAKVGLKVRVEVLSCESHRPS